MDFRFLRHLWYFLAVAEERSFGRAAARLGMSQPPLSQQIQILERVLGVSLFERSHTGATLTREGEAILPAVQQLAGHAQRLEALARQARAGSAGSVTIGTITFAMFELLPRFVREARKLHQGLTISLVEMDTADALRAVENGDIDLAFIRAHYEGGQIRVEPLTHDQMVVALPAEHPLAQQQRVKLADLAQEPMVMFPRRISPAYYDSIISACYTNGFSPRLMHEVSSVHSQVGFVACGIGVALVPGGIARRGAAGVVFRPLAEPFDVLTIAVAWNVERKSPIISSLIQLAKRSLDTGHIGWMPPS